MGRGVAVGVPLAVVMLALAACIPVSMSGNISSASCGNMPSGACDEQIMLFEQRFPDAVSIDFECRVAACTRAAGSGTVVVTFADGTNRNDTFTYAGDLVPMPAPRCVAVAADVCREIAQAVWDDQPPSRTVVAMQVSCVTQPCTKQKGNAEIDVGFADGSTTTTGWGWEGELP
jgi:hypothetical protein